MDVIYGGLSGPGYNSPVNHETRFLLVERSTRTIDGWLVNLGLGLNEEMGALANTADADGAHCLSYESNCETILSMGSEMLII
jgi:hypothetical protein